MIMDSSKEYIVGSEVFESDMGFCLCVVVSAGEGSDFSEALLLATDEFLELSGIIRDGVNAQMEESSFIEANFRTGEYRFRQEFMTTYESDESSQMSIAGKILDDYWSDELYSEDDQHWLEAQLATIGDEC